MRSTVKQITDQSMYVPENASLNAIKNHKPPMNHGLTQIWCRLHQYELHFH